MFTISNRNCHVYVVIILVIYFFVVNKNCLTDCLHRVKNDDLEFLVM
jgi:hypothetical protein